MLNKIFLLTLFIVPIFVRFLWLDKVPPGLIHDEADAIFIAQSYSKFGTDSLGTKFPLSIIKNQVETGDDTLFSLMLTPFYRVLPLNLFTARIPSVIINLLTGLSLFVLISKLSSNKRLPIIFLLLWLYSPWSLVFSRSITQSPLSLFMIILAFCLYLRQSRWSVPGSVTLLSLAFVAYYGSKPLVVVLAVLIPIWHGLITKNFNWNKSIKFWSAMFIVIGIYLFIAIRTPGSTFMRRSSETKLFDMNSYSSQVDLLRRSAIESKYNFLLINKPILLAKNLINKYYNFFSPDYLFFSGDPQAIHRFSEHGVAYLVELPLFFIGLSLVFSESAGIIGLLMLILGPMGTVINTLPPSNMYRGNLFLPGFLIIVSLGIYRLIQVFGKKAVITIFIIYCPLVITFYHFYFYSYPVMHGESSYFGERILSNVVLRTSSPVIIVASQPLQILQQIMFFANYFEHLPVSLISKDGPFIYKNITITATCPKNSNSFLIVQSNINCNLKSTGPIHVIQDQKDTGSLWFLYNDQLCSDSQLSFWKRFHLRSQYNVETLSQPAFCEDWIANYKTI